MASAEYQRVGKEFLSDSLLAGRAMLLLGDSLEENPRPDQPIEAVTPGLAYVVIHAVLL